MVSKNKTFHVRKEKPKPVSFYEKEIEIDHPTLGKIKQKVKVAVYPAQKTPEPTKYELPLNLDEQTDEES